MFLKQSSTTATYTELRTEDLGDCFPYDKRYFGKTGMKKRSLTALHRREMQYNTNGSCRTEIHDVALSFVFITKQWNYRVWKVFIHFWNTLYNLKFPSINITLISLHSFSPLWKETAFPETGAKGTLPTSVNQSQNQWCLQCYTRFTLDVCVRSDRMLISKFS